MYRYNGSDSIEVLEYWNINNNDNVSQKDRLLALKNHLFFDFTKKFGM
jgi:hypothetical protein